MHPLDDPLNKMQRAYEHLKELDRQVRAYKATCPYSVAKKLNADKTSYIYRIEPGSLPDPRIATILGDAIHNMRSSLDHLAWQLALLNTATPYHRTEFPIYKDRTSGNVKAVRRKLQDVPTKAADLIERLQPYNSGDRHKAHPLWILHALWNIDKHSLLLPISHMGWVPVFYGPGGSCEVLDDGTIIITVPVEVDAELDIEPQITTDIAFPLDSPGGGMEVRELLWSIYKALDNLVFPALSRFFPEQEPPRRISVQFFRQDTPPSTLKG
jgi:hypothetical protein